ncbi:protein FAM167B [Latimeria chalumnae]|uniref:Family with sequence similarity 167 member B n=1 Tax=Latimeria chalumnae TaxID=7897 RepID=H3AY84_LATCH|nr:PREDICTED: protein FAM167B [Latimeria chalumnae]|eukprot:XP_006003303.1 PREDICTED: protein FAM167B [Latimeria chalumnae]
MMTSGSLDFQELGKDDSDTDQDGLDSVKALAEKLNLQTRRPSYVEWREKVQSQTWRSQGGGQKGLGSGVREKEGHLNLQGRLINGKDKEDNLGNICGFSSIDEALEWLRNELREMQALDHQLARCLMKLRGEIHKVKVEQACHRHKEMLDDATFGLEGCNGEDSDLVCDIPLKATFTLSTPLKHIGVTKMNINSRRFSLC